VSSGAGSQLSSARQERCTGVWYRERSRARGLQWSARPMCFGPAQRIVTSLIYSKYFKWLEWN
jgi:hypothetical protein